MASTVPGIERTAYQEMSAPQKEASKDRLKSLQHHESCANTLSELSKPCGPHEGNRMVESGCTEPHLPHTTQAYMLRMLDACNTLWKHSPASAAAGPSERRKSRRPHHKPFGWKRSAGSYSHRSSSSFAMTSSRRRIAMRGRSCSNSASVSASCKP